MVLGLDGWLSGERVPTLPSPLRALVDSEAVATLREVVLLPRDISAVVPDARPGDDVVVLVHGFMASAGVFRPLRKRLERDCRAKVATFTHAPGAGVRRIAKRLARLVDGIPHGARIHVVGHSLGGVVARWFVQELRGHARVTQTISLASPFGGTHFARRVPVLVGADLCAQSELLARIRHRAGAFRVPHVSVVAGEDRLIAGEESASFPHGEVIVLPGRGHNTLLFDDEVARIVIDRIHRFRNTSP
jgi:pimeloyl-ACP methyl ester carboxylesterase